MILYRPVGEKELLLIEESGFTKFPPRLPQQPIFYPVLNKKYAEEIALRWNTKDSLDSNNKGFVLIFEINDDFIKNYDIQIVGKSYHQEYWIPSEDLNMFNKNIIGSIKILSSFY